VTAIRRLTRRAWVIAGLLFAAALAKHVLENGWGLFWQQSFGGVV
jgi:hypothetical protein